MKTDESLYLDFPALDPTVILALAQDVPTWKEDAVVEASLRDMLAGLNESAQTEAAVAALDLEEQQLQKQGGDGSSDQSLAEDFHWPEELEFLHHVCPNKSQHSLVRALRQNEGDLEVSAAVYLITVQADSETKTEHFESNLSRRALILQ